jgi:hypothetical protein
VNYAVAAKLGWSNPDTGPEPLRLYATDRGDSPRWASPHARTVETALIEYGVEEGARAVVVTLPAGITSLQLDQCALACLGAVAAVLAG